MSSVSTQIRDLQSRINSLSERLTNGIDQHHQHQAEESVSDQLVSVAGRVEELLTGRERLSVVAGKLTSMEHLLIAPSIGEDESLRDAKMSEELLLLEEQVIREESMYYEEIKRLQPLLDHNHLAESVSETESKSDVTITDLTTAAEDQAEKARQVRLETDQLMQFNADLSKCINDLLAEWDKKIRRIENK